MFFIESSLVLGEVFELEILENENYIIIVCFIWYSVGYIDVR